MGRATPYPVSVIVNVFTLGKRSSILNQVKNNKQVNLFEDML